MSPQLIWLAWFIVTSIVYILVGMPYKEFKLFIVVPIAWFLSWVTFRILGYD